jgi:hypothetical protein
VSGSLQLGFSDYEQAYAKKKTRRHIFHDKMESTIPWDGFNALIRPVYHQPSSKGGRPPFRLEVMLRIHLLHQWFTLSDPLMEEMLIDTPCFRRADFRGAQAEAQGSRCPAAGADDPRCHDHPRSRLHQEQEG